MSTLPAVPPVPDSDRVTFVVSNTAVSAIPVPFPVYGTAEDLTVIVNFVPLDASGWTFSSASGASLSVLPLPITDGLVTLNSPAVGTIEIVGNWQPRQVIQPSAPGIARREFNQVLSMIISGLREIQRLVRTALQFVQTTASGAGYFDARGFRVANVADATLATDAVNLETLLTSLSSYVASGALGVLRSWSATGDGAALSFSLAAPGVTLPASPLAYIVSANSLIVDPGSYTINQSAQTILFSLAPANGAAISIRVFLASLTTTGATSNLAVRSASASGTDTASLADGLVYWNTPFVGAKNQHIPAANTAPQNFRLTIADARGDAATNPIVVTPTAGTINGKTTVTMNVGSESLDFAADPANNNWVIV